MILKTTTVLLTSFQKVMGDISTLSGVLQQLT